MIFFTEDDYHAYVAALRQAKSPSQCRIYAYVLMTNHVHLLVEPLQAADLGRFMQSVGRPLRPVYQCYLSALRDPVGGTV